MARPEADDSEQSFLSHLVELRSRLMRAVVAVLIVLVVLLPFANDLYAVLAVPLLEQMPAGASMIAIEVASPFLAPFKLAFFVALFIAMPVILYQGWGFVAPGLYRHEKRFALPLVASSVVLFYLGCAFAYFVVFPLVFGFFSSVAPTGVAVMTDISKYLDFVLVLFMAFGLAFEVPIAVVLLTWTGLVTPESLSTKRPYVVVGAFALGMLLTPPDVISQTLLALPMWLLFEVGLIMARFTGARDQEPDAENSDIVDGN